MALRVKGAHRFTSFPLIQMAEEDSLILAWRQTGYGRDSFVFWELPLGVVHVGACVEAGSVGRARCSSRISCGIAGMGSGRAGSTFTQQVHFQVCLLCSQSPLDGPFSLWVHAIKDVSMPDG